MPQPIRTRPGISQVPRAVPGRVTRPPPEPDPFDGFVPVSEAVDPWEHMLLYGTNRVGKTTFACQFPKPLWICSLEPCKTGGARSIELVEGVVWKKFDSSHQLEKLGVRCTNTPPDQLPFQTLVLDGGTSLDEIVLKEICGWSETAVMLKFGKVSNDQYTERSERVRNVLRPFTNLERHLIIICNEKDHAPQSSERNVMKRGPHSGSHYAAALGGATVKWLQDAMDHVCQMYMDNLLTPVTTVRGRGKSAREVTRWVDTGRFIRRLRLMFHPNYAGGIRARNPQGVPDYVEGETPQQLYDNFMAVVSGTYQMPANYLPVDAPTEPSEDEGDEAEDGTETETPTTQQ